MSVLRSGISGNATPSLGTSGSYKAADSGLACVSSIVTSPAAVYRFVAEACPVEARPGEIPRPCKVYVPWVV